ncbi:MAG: hypothetical protein JSV91_04185 [Phycisphaerales bacterium]|nr:MAG: hypothetical protein JSV91_04185 [Phycisphaerales bacterium]
MMRRRRYVVRLTIQILCVQCMALGAAAVLAWLLGRLLSDRWAFSQWLLWIPTAAMLPAVLLGIFGALAPGRKVRLKRRRLRIWALCAICIAGYFSFIEHRLFRGAPPAQGELTIAHWNMTHWRTEADRLRVLDLLCDITILVDAWGLRRDPDLLDSLPEDQTAFYVRRFMIITNQPIIEARPLIAHDAADVALLRLDCTETLGRELVVYAVDLPSDPKLPRARTARQLRDLIAEADGPPPDVVVGDFNMTRNGAALGFAFPSLHHAFDDGGHGYTASYHRVFPLYHIDHILLNDSLRAVRYDLINPNLGRHCIQKAWISNESGATPAGDR